MRTQSASAITSFKLCPMKYYLQYVKRLKLIEEPEARRVGTNWHKCMEVLAGNPDDPTETLAAHLTDAYAIRPPYIETDAWDLERIILLYSALGWNWFHGEDKIETVATELRFDRAVHSRLKRTGRIDRIVRWHGRPMLVEYKSTAQSLDADSPYWDRLNMDTQISMYLLEARHMQMAGDLSKYALKATDPLISGCLYDVWRKPSIRPKKIKGERETSEQFGERLLEDIQERPEFYFCRREIPRTDAELEAADKEFNVIARTLEFMEARDLWFTNEYQCLGMGRCDFLPICSHHLDIDTELPEGFRRS